ncbi:hypothetical protein [Treponema endosymbiont of Eucomonympha sp.]|uniref:hypothetical protein n=1 Tax=Treponema endosymbiont of Eucomonympha sp. TaxID=1580831 RepID=UPI000785A095|nr:hypothetical protein [Treponema endosymbiont of Eucomonympha sp.]
MLDYIPREGNKFYEWAQTFAAQADDKATRLNIDADALAALKAKLGDFLDAWAEYQKPDRGKSTTTAKNTAMLVLKKAVRAFYGQFLKGNPALSAADRDDFGLPQLDTAYSPVPPPGNQATAKHRPLGDHLLELDIEIIGDILPDAKASDYGFRVYWGIMPQGGASVEAATGPKRELMKAPAGGEELPFSRFTRRKREVFDFAESDRGKTVSFCIRLENAKGQAGPWGTVFSTIIP